MAWSVSSAAIPGSEPASSSPAVAWARISRPWPTSPATTIQATTRTTPMTRRTTRGAPSQRGTAQRSSRSTRGTKIAARMAAKTSGMTRSLMSPSTTNAIASRTAMPTSSQAPRPRAWSQAGTRRPGSRSTAGILGPPHSVGLTPGTACRAGSRSWRPPRPATRSPSRSPGRWRRWRLGWPAWRRS